jgi:hypothetical protein
MLAAMTSRYHDSGILAVGFSTAILIDGVFRAFAAPGAADHHYALARLLCGIAVGPLIVVSLLLRQTIPHRIFLVLGLFALVMYAATGLR